MYIFFLSFHFLGWGVFFLVGGNAACCLVTHAVCSIALVYSYRTYLPPVTAYGANITRVLHPPTSVYRNVVTSRLARMQVRVACSAVYGRDLMLQHVKAVF